MFFFVYPKFDSFFQFALIIWKEMAMASNGLGPWFHKKIVDPLIQILRRYSQKILSLPYFFLFFVCGCGLLGVIELKFGGILLGLCSITHWCRSLIVIMRFPCLDFGDLFVKQALSSGLKQLRDLKNRNEKSDAKEARFDFSSNL